MYQRLNIFLPDGSPAPCIKRISDCATIPFDMANRDYVEYLNFLEAGNEPLPPDEPEPSPALEVTP